ncbi:unnamed protein product [Linum tenue]|uniref:Uncharacterized protein n=1 Tax=Linum tenue TaxID=586396 RepID=A0AAV0KR30_9ROSI|nr:unnamed protein product [Linum tenue]
MNLGEEAEEVLWRNWWRKDEISSVSVGGGGAAEGGDGAAPYRSAMGLGRIPMAKNLFERRRTVAAR